MTHFNRLTWRQKNKFLWIGSLVFMLVIYQLAIRKTIEAHQQLTDVQLTEKEKIALRGELSSLQEKEQQLSELFTRWDNGENKGKSEPERLALMAEEYEVVFKEIHGGKEYDTETASIHYNNYAFSGSFVNLVRLLDAVEATGRVFLVQIGFRKKEFIQAEPQLFLDLITVNIERHKT